MTRREVLNGAADLIERNGWCQETGRRDGGYCVAAAIEEIGGAQRISLVVDTQFLLRDHVAGYIGIRSWNDDLRRTAAEVIAKLREVAALPEAAV